MLPFLQAIIGDMISIMAVLAVVAGMVKLFQIAASLNEIKDLLADIKRNTNDYSVTPADRPAWETSSPSSPESLLRAVGSEPEATQTSVLEPER